MDIEQIKYQESVKAWHRNSLVKELVIIFLSVFGLSVLAYFSVSMADKLIISLMATSCFSFFVAIMCSIISINISIEALENEIALNGVKSGSSIVTPVQMTAFYFAIVCLMSLYFLPVLVKV